jgi:hypothetical protein
MSRQAAFVRTFHAGESQKKDNKTLPWAHTLNHESHVSYTSSAATGLQNARFLRPKFSNKPFHPSKEVTDTPPPPNTPYQTTHSTLFFFFVSLLKAEESAFALGRTAGE